MSAARRRGQWVGGTPVLGYDVAPGGGKLVINEREAHQVRETFGLCLEHGALSPVLQEIQKRGWMTKRWTTKSGKLHPGRLFGEHDLVRLLSNVIYIGKVCYQGQIYAGEQAAIVEEKVWERVQRLLQKRGRSLPKKPRTRLASPAGNGRRTGRPQCDIECDMESPRARAENSPNGVPRITRLLALAVKFDGLLQQGVVQNYAELARFGRVSRARITQIMNLLSLAPDIQQQILSWSGEPPGGQSVRESWVRALSAEVIWSRQREQWNRCLVCQDSTAETRAR
jgi:hypothetical protein